MSMRRTLSTVSGQEDLFDLQPIKWINIVFVPFNPVFKLMILICVLVRCYMAPLESVFHPVACMELMDTHPLLELVKFIYVYVAEFLYITDIFLHIIHRQISDEAMKREFLPKSAILLAVDVLSLIPLAKMVTDEACPPIQLWPNVLSMIECIVIYRVVIYFELASTHSSLSLLVGYILVLSIMVHSISCLLLLITEPKCIACRDIYKDWRIVYSDMKETPLVMYTFAGLYVTSYWARKLMHVTKPKTIVTFVATCMFMVMGWLAYNTILIPKIFAEVVMSARRLCEYHPQVERALDETRRRNPGKGVVKTVERYYALMWEKRSGIFTMPPGFAELPKYMRVDITQDITWPMFYHSPNIRRTSPQFKRWLCDRVELTYRIPGDSFFTGAHCFTNMYYLKSGVVQFLSSDDAGSAMLSVTGGTIFGDVSFYAPPHERRNIVRCLTYCEVHSIARGQLVRALHLFPEDRKQLIARAKDRLQHAKDLQAQKKKANLGESTCGDESIEWLKKRWWELYDIMQKFKMRKQKSNKRPIENDPVPYHCSRFIGQLVLSRATELSTHVMFTKATFPWVLAPESGVARYWQKIVKLTTVVVVVLFPPNLARSEPERWFFFVKFFCDSVYIADIVLSLVTQVDRKGYNPTFIGNCAMRCKTFSFHLDVMASPLFEHALDYVFPGTNGLTTFNRLIKVYQLLGDDTKKNWRVNPVVVISRKIGLCFFLYYYAVPYALVVVTYNWPSITRACFFTRYCSPQYLASASEPCHSKTSDILNPVIGWVIHELFTDAVPYTFNDVMATLVDYFVNYMFRLVARAYFIAILALKYRDGFDYYKFVKNVSSYFKYNRIHPDLMKRLERYLVCHWKYYCGMELTNPQSCKSLPYEIYHKMHGEVAERILRSSGAFEKSSSTFIRELAAEVSFLVLPKNTTLVLFGSVCKNVMWLSQGSVRAEYHDDAGELQKSYLEPGALLAVNSVFMEQASVITYTTASDVEMLYIERDQFSSVLKRNPNEWEAVTRVAIDLRPVFTRILTRIVKKHRDLQKRQRARSMQLRKSLAPAVLSASKTLPDGAKSMTAVFIFLSSYRQDPESQFILTWMAYQCAAYPLQMLIYSLSVGLGARYRFIWKTILQYADYLDILDIFIKIFKPYYNKDGIIITNVRLCFLYYFRHNFIIDVIGSLPIDKYVDKIFFQSSLMRSKDRSYFISSFLDLASETYMFTGFLNYLADVPTARKTLLMVMKWMILSISVIFCFTPYFVSNCLQTTVIYTEDDTQVTHEFMEHQVCWLAKQTKIFDKSGNVSADLPYLLTAYSFTMSLSGMFGTVIGDYQIITSKRRTTLLIMFSVFFWMATFRCIALLILHGRGDLNFQLDLAQLRAFLEDERIDRKVIDRLTNYFGYWWLRTKGLDVKKLMSKKIGLVFKQDLNYFLYKKTLEALDGVLDGGETLQRDLAAAASEHYLLPGEHVVREEMIAHHVYIVHRGKVTLRVGDQTVSIGKGCVFGQLLSPVPRPSPISARAETHVDVLAIPTAVFYDVQTDRSRACIEQHPDSALDFLRLPKPVTENPYNTVEYLLRAQMTLKLPLRRSPWVAFTHAWFDRWLFAARVLNVWLSLMVTSTTINMRRSHRLYGLVLMGFFDVIHLLYFVSQFFMLELVVSKRRLVHRYVRLRRFKQWQTYCDVVGLLVPLGTAFVSLWVLQMARLLRLYHVFEYFNDLSQQINTTYKPVFIKVLMLVLVLHVTATGWQYVACYYHMEDIHTLTEPKHLVKDVDMTIWTFLHTDRHEGCLTVIDRTLAKGMSYDENTKRWMFVPVHWYHDYVIAYTMVLTWFARINSIFMLPLSVLQAYYQVFMSIIIFLAEIIVSTALISAVYTKIRALYQFDYQMLTMVSYFKHNDLSPNVMAIFYYYMRVSWMRNRGTSLPVMLYQLPPCLREDVFSELYIHHLRSSSVFNKLPDYFLRQLAQRLNRLVMFPGKCIVNVGDILPIVYFIHEGEVEKWAMDNTGDGQLVNVLSTCGFFGIVPGLFPAAPFQNSFYSRTMVDMMTLRYEAWQDLLRDHPKVKALLYEEANKYKKQTYNINIFHW